MNIRNILLLLFTFALVCCGRKPQKSDIVIHPEQVISKEFIGNGVEFSAYPHGDTESSQWGKLMTDEKWQQVFDRVSFMKLKIVRVMDQANWRYLKGVDANGNLVVDFKSDQMQALYKLLDYCQQNNIIVIIGEWGQPYKLHDVYLNLEHTFTGANDPKWINLIIQNLKHLCIEKKYTCIKYFNLVNEPNGYWATTDGDWDQWKEGILMLEKAIRDNDLSKHISIIGPDATNYDNPKSKYKGLDWAKQTAIQIPNVVTAYDVHDYPSKESIRSGEFEKTFGNLVRFTDSIDRKPFILGELGIKGAPSSKVHLNDKFTSEDSQISVYDYDYGVDMADGLIQAMNAGFDAVIAWDLDDAMHTNGDKGEKHQLKRWGMWNILGEELTGDKTDENIRPWFYTWSLMCRNFTADMKIVKMDDLKLKGVRTVVGITKSKDITIAIVNNGDKMVNFTIGTDNLKKGTVLQKYLYSESMRPVDKNGFPVPLEKSAVKDKPIMVSIPEKSVIIYTSYK